MQDEIHSTGAPGAKKGPDGWLVDGLKKQAVTVFIAVFWAFYTFIWNSQTNQTDIKHEVENNSKAIEKLISADKEQSDLNNQFLIGLTKSSEAINRMALDIRDIQTQQQKNTEQLLQNRK